MDENQLRFYTTQALYGKELQERQIATRQLVEADLSPAEIEAVRTRVELALGREDEYVRSAAALLLDGLAEKVLVSPTMARELLALSRSPEAFAREAALRAMKRLCERGHFFSMKDKLSMQQRLEEARHSEGEEFVFSLFEV